ncbi:MAG: tyrosine-type recombinase/integrase [Thermoanaerobaculia bacterium]
MIGTRRTKAGKKRYWVRVDLPGGRQDWRGTFDTLAEARHEEAVARTERRARARMNCDRFARFWLEGYRERVKASSHDTAAGALAKFTEDFRGIPLHRLDRIAAERWARENRWRVPAVTTMLNAAVEAELIRKNPFSGLTRKGEGRRHTAPLDEAELHQFAAAALRVHGRYGQMMSSLILFLAHTGLRVGEAFALEWGDIDFEAMRVRVERRVYRGELDLPKPNRTHRAVLTPAARDALLPLSRTGSLVFTAKRGGRLSQSALAWYWAPVAAAAGRRITPHELRHFAAHHLYVRLGLPARVVGAQLGHKGPKLVTDLYGHGDVGALEEIDRAFADNVVELRRAR